MHLGGEDGADVRLVMSILLQALEKKVNLRGVGDVRGRRDARTADEKIADIDASEAIDDDRARVALGRERA